jgi:hypothetical protein
LRQRPSHAPHCGWGAKDIVAVDLSDAVEVAFTATRDLPNAHIIQADIFRSAAAPRVRLRILCRRPPSLAESRARIQIAGLEVKSGGHMSAWIYGAENNGWIVSFVKSGAPRDFVDESPRTFSSVKVARGRIVSGHEIDLRPAESRRLGKETGASSVL